MGVLARAVERRYSLADMDKDMDTLIVGRNSVAGVSVTENSALYSLPVLACVKVLAETLASLPLPTYRRLEPRGKERAFDYPLYSLLHDAPNPEMTSFSFREALEGHLCTWGNAFAEIDWDMSAGQIRGLWPLRPDRMKVGRENGKLIYAYRLPDGSDVKLPAYRVWHIPGFGFDGLVGYSPIQLAREAIGLAMATEEFGARFFGNGARPGGVLKHPNKLSPTGLENIKKSWKETHEGLSNVQRIAILEEGMEYQAIGIPPEDAQFLETRKYQRTEIASLFRVPPHMIGDLERATFSNIEQQSIEFVVYTMRPWLVRWEQTIMLKLIVPEDRQEYFSEFLVDGLLRGDTLARYQAYAIARQWGWFSADDIREIENMNPLPEGQGDIYLVPLNMVPAGSAQPPPKPPPDAMPTQEAGKRALLTSNPAIIRQRTAASYKPVVDTAAARIVEREKQDILRAARKHLKQRSLNEFQTWLDDFYRDFGSFVAKEIKPGLSALVEAIVPLAAEEVNAKTEIVAGQMPKFVDDYATDFAARYTGSSKGQLRQVIQEASQSADASPEVAVQRRLDEWEQNRPGKVAENEMVRISNATAKVVFAAAGIKVLRWMATGSDNCPFCQELDGKTVGIEQEFLGQGTELDAGGKQMTVKRNVGHPPIHQGCQCQIIPG